MKGLGFLSKLGVEVDLDRIELFVVVADFHSVFNQSGGNPVGAIKEFDNRGLVRGSEFPPQESDTDFFFVQIVDAGGIFQPPFLGTHAQLRVFAVVVFLIEPCEESFVELVEGMEGGGFHFGDEVVDAEAVEGLYFAMTLRSIGGGVDGLVDAELGAQDLHMVCPEDHGVIVIDAKGFSVTLQSAFEDELQGGEISLEEEAAGEKKTGGIVDEGIQIRAAHFARVFGVGQPGPLEHVGLPQIIGIIGLESVQVLAIGDGEFSVGESFFLQGSVQGGSAQQPGGASCMFSMMVMIRSMDRSGTWSLSLQAWSMSSLGIARMPWSDRGLSLSASNPPLR